MLSFDARACFGGSPGLANFRTKEDIFNGVCSDTPTVVNPKRLAPQPVSSDNGDQMALPKFLDGCIHLATTSMRMTPSPGCPPPSDLVVRLSSPWVATNFH